MDFGTLQSVTADWLHRTDLGAVIPNFINIALHNIEQEYSFRGMLKRTTTAVAAGGSSVTPAPTDYKAIKEAWWVDQIGQRWLLTKDSEAHAVDVSPNITTDTSQQPDFISYLPSGLGTFVFMFRPTPAVAGTLDLVYYAYSPDLSASTDTNYMLLGSWQLLLYGALAEAADYLADTAGQQKWSAKRDVAARKFINAEISERFTGPQETKSAYVIESYGRRHR